MPTIKYKYIKEQLMAIEAKMLKASNPIPGFLESLHPDQRRAGQNLLNYLVLRKEDVRELQNSLHIAGLSSLASSESHIHRQLQAILELLGKKYEEAQLDPCSYSWSAKSIENKSETLFGPKREGFAPAIMVTFDASFADNYALIKGLLQNGMTVARINCAHDHEGVWSKMISKLKKACKNTGLSCKIYMDLAGPKIRTQLLTKGKSKGRVKVKEGEIIWLAYDTQGFDKDEVVISPNELDIVGKIKKGDRVYIDDGVVHAVAEKIKKESVGIRITRISSKKNRIKEEKGINFPDTRLDIPSLTEYDKECLPFICEHADLVGYSFVRHAADIDNLQHSMTQITDQPPHVILKIETPEAVENLPSLLTAAMKQAAFGVMIARGDLAVEIGFERMGEIQEEILWICEAAHVPVVWATQVLESLNKSGMITRSEVTDASNAAQAECVMINKGPHTLEVLEVLKDILQRTSSHRMKKRYTFRPLSIASRFFDQQMEQDG